MDRERWPRIDEIFHAVCERPEAERSRCLDEACSGDAALRARIEQLLRYDDPSPSFVDAPPVRLPEAASADAAPDPFVGQAIGVYRLRDRVGAGGMGVIYRAVRDDDLFDHEIAVKLVRRGMDTDRILDRFRVERQALAALDHPNIARLLDGGATGDGLPYLVMELVDGRPIDEFCDERRSSVSERLRLFATVCRAVHYAHRHLVVHRDLKPSNILITGEGVPKLLDFGIAKILHPPGEQRSLVRTETASRILTPDYASPEQIRGDPVSTATDVYSLGVVLYGLLTGRRPYSMTSARLEDVERAVCDQVPRRPSTAIEPASPEPEAGRGADPPATPRRVAALRASTPERLRRRLRGDLDNIVLKSLAKEPDRRYASAEQFAADVERYLEGLPVLARKDTVLYRTRKFVRRHRAGVASAVVVAASLTGAALVMVRLAHVAAVERDAARLAGQRAEEAAAHARIEADSARETADSLARALVIATAGETEEELAPSLRYLERDAERIRRQYSDLPHLRANLIDGIGRALMHMRRAGDARPLLEEAAAIRRAEFGEQSLEMARSLDSLGELHLLDGDHVGAAALFGRALELHRSLPADVHTDVAAAAGSLARALRVLGRLEEAGALCEEALRLRRESLGAEHPLVADTLIDLARVEHDRGDDGAARLHWEQAVRIRRRVLPSPHAALGATLTEFGLFLVDTGEAGAAEPLLREALEECRAALPSGHWSTAAAEAALGADLLALGRFEEAEAALTHAHAVLRRATDEAREPLRRARADLRRLDEALGRPLPVEPE